MIVDLNLNMPYVVKLFVIKVFKKEQGKFFLIFLPCMNMGMIPSTDENRFSQKFGFVIHLDMTSSFF